jgi:multiple sugar transport system permease protein
MNNLSIIKKGMIYAILLIFCIIAIFPLLYALSISLKNPVDAFTTHFKWIFNPSFEYHKTLWVERGFVKYLLNSLFIALSTVVISVPLATVAAYGLVRHNSSFSNNLLNSLLTLRMFPPMLLAVPYFLLGSSLNMFDTKTILVLVNVAANQPFAIWLMRGFLLQVPKELDEAAVIDGCSSMSVLTRVILPVAAPGIATASIFSFLLSYNEYLFALVLTGTNAKTLPIAIGQYGAEDLTYWSLSAAGVVGIIIPVILIMVFLQRWFVKGLTAGAIKG